MRSTTRLPVAVLGVILGFPAVSPHVAAQQAPAPVVQFAAGGIGLDEAVRMTLQYDANIRRSQGSFSRWALAV